MRRDSILLFSLFWFSSCGGAEDVGDDTQPADLSEFPAWTVSQDPLLTIGRWDDSREGHDLQDVRGTFRLSDGSVAVADASVSEIRIFKIDGVLERTIGRRGSGPGEIRKMSATFIVPGDTLVVLDAGNGRLTAFDRFGVLSFESRWILGRYVLGAVVGGRLLEMDFEPPLLADGLSPASELEAFLTRTDGRNRKLGIYPGRRLIQASVGGRRQLIPQPFGPGWQASAWGGRVAIGSTERNAIDVFNERGTKLHVIPLGLRRRQVERADAEGVVRSYGYARAIEQGLLDAMVAPARAPGFSSLLVGTDGSIWVREFVDRDAEAVDWYCFDSSGSPAGKLRLPSVLRVSQVGTDFVLGRTQGEYGEALVQLFSLVRGQEDAMKDGSG